MSERAIVHLDLDAFYVGVEQVADPALRERPVIVAFGGVYAPRTAVASCSYEARQSGVTSGMALKRARKLCPEAVILPGNPDLYMRASQALFGILRDYSPVIEPASQDEAYLDLTGTTRLLGIPADVGSRIQPPACG